MPISQLGKTDIEMQDMNERMNNCLDRGCTRRCCHCSDFVISQFPTISVVASWICVLVILCFPYRVVIVTVSIVFAVCFLTPLVCFILYIVMRRCCEDEHHYITV